MSHRDREGAPHPVDVHVGGRVRAARLKARLSLTALATRVGVAFQQLQKYERGANRISASMLYELARALKAPVASFFDGLPPAGQAAGLDAARAARLEALLACPGGLELLDSFLALPAPAQVHLKALLQALGPGRR